MLIGGDEARAKHIGKGLLLLGGHLLLGLGSLELVLETVDRRELVLDGLLLCERRHLGVEDLLPPSAARGGSFHTEGQQKFGW